MCRQAVKSRQLILQSSGSQRRDFIPLTDVCQAVDHLIQLPRTMLGKGVFNLGGKSALTILEMSYLIQRRCECVLGFKPKLSFASVQEEERSIALEYQINILEHTNFRLSMKQTEEIDQLLVFCKDYFYAT